MMSIGALTLVACGDTEDPPAEAKPVQVASGPRPTGLAESATRAQLQARSLAVAARAGVAAPSRVIAVAAADQAAAELALTGTVLFEHQPVYVVQMTGGTFTASRHPHGQPAPQGNSLTVTFDAATLAITSIGIDNVTPDLSKVDSVAAVDLTPDLGKVPAVDLAP
jgi:hypothetical protein